MHILRSFIHFNIIIEHRLQFSRNGCFGGPVQCTIVFIILYYVIYLLTYKQGWDFNSLCSPKLGFTTMIVLLQIRVEYF